MKYKVTKKCIYCDYRCTLFSDPGNHYDYCTNICKQYTDLHEEQLIMDKDEFIRTLNDNCNISKVEVINDPD